MTGNLRIGEGYDVHKLVPNRDLILGGVKIPFSLGLLGHSDADVLAHAICDALLGAAALGDIGSHFPDDSAVYKNISSMKLLGMVKEILDGSNYRLVNVDSTLVLEKPYVSEHIFSMRKNISRELKMDIMSAKIH